VTATPFARYAARKGVRPAAPPGPWVLLAAWGPCGFSPVAPGTVGTLGAIPLYLALSRLGPGAYVAVTAALVALGSSPRSGPDGTGASRTRRGSWSTRSRGTS
jgi:hypothetical protein